MFNNCNKRNCTRCNCSNSQPFTARADCFAMPVPNCVVPTPVVLQTPCCAPSQTFCYICENKPNTCCSQQKCTSNCCEKNNCCENKCNCCEKNNSCCCKPACETVSNCCQCCQQQNCCCTDCPSFVVCNKPCNCCNQDSCCCCEKQESCCCQDGSCGCNKADCGCITVNVIDCSSAAVIPNAEVTIYDADGNVAAAGLTNANGNFTATCLNFGTFTINAYNKTTEITQTTAVTINCANKDVETQICFATPVSGTITATVVHCVSGVALPGVRVRLYNSQFNLIDEQLTDVNGMYTKTNLPADTYYLEFFDSTSGQTHFRQTIINSTTTNPQLNECFRDSTGEIGLRVIICDTTTPIANAQVRLLDENRTVVATGTTDANGLFDQQNLPFGTYFLDVIDTVSRQVQENEVAITVGRPTNFVVNCFDRCTNPIVNVTGTVTDNCGNPICGAIVVVKGNITRQGVTDASGNYSISGIESCDGFTITAMHCGRSKRVIFNTAVKQNYNINFRL